MAKNKTVKTEASVSEFLESTCDGEKLADARELVKLMGRVSEREPAMWGKSIVGFGMYRYKYDSGREGEMIRLGFSPRKTALTLYILPGFEAYDGLLPKLGKHKIGKSCLYIKKLNDIDRDVLEQLVHASHEHMAVKYPE
ncbi:MAG: hypothetical protein ACJAYU_004639 [Bradymonadia bacterium]|jgi:hypothetical protein